MFQQCYKLGTAQQCNMTSYTPAMFKDWKHLSNVIRQEIRQECFEVGYSSAV